MPADVLARDGARSPVGTRLAGRWTCFLPVSLHGLFNLTHWGRDKMDAISQTTFSIAFSWMKIFEYRLKLHWNLFLRVQLTIFQHWFRWWLGVSQATSHYLNQWWLVYRRVYASLGLNELIFATKLFNPKWWGRSHKIYRMVVHGLWESAAELNCLRVYK